MAANDKDSGERSVIIGALWLSIAAAAAALAVPNENLALGVVSLPLAALLLARLARPRCRTCGSNGKLSTTRNARAEKGANGTWYTVRTEVSVCGTCGASYKRELHERAGMSEAVLKGF